MTIKIHHSDYGYLIKPRFSPFNYPSSTIFLSFQQSDVMVFSLILLCNKVLDFFSLFFNGPLISSEFKYVLFLQKVSMACQRNVTGFRIMVPLNFSTGGYFLETGFITEDHLSSLSTALLSSTCLKSIRCTSNPFRQTLSQIIVCLTAYYNNNLNPKPHMDT